jgi:hypothetical protein
MLYLKGRIEERVKIIEEGAKIRHVEEARDN